MPDTTAADLLRAVIADPEDTAARLILCDWWEEYGTEEDRIGAEFVRVQIELAEGQVPDCTYGCPRDDCERCRLRRRERELLESFAPGFPRERRRRHWLRPLLDIMPPGWEATRQFSDLQFCRGFVEEMEAHVSLWLDRADELRRAMPLRKVSALVSRNDLHSGQRWDFIDREMDTIALRNPRGGFFSSHPYNDLPGDGSYILNWLLEKQWPRIKFTLVESPR